MTGVRFRKMRGSRCSRRVVIFPSGDILLVAWMTPSGVAVSTEFGVCRISTLPCHDVAADDRVGGWEKPDVGWQIRSWTPPGGYLKLNRLV